MATTGAGLLHRPDLILQDLDGHHSFTLIEIRTFDPACATAIAVDHTDTTRLAHHTALQASALTEYFGPSGAPPAHLRLRLVVFTVSIYGSLGSQAQSLLTRLGALTGRTVPPTLLAESTWATPLFAPFARQAITLAARRALASSLRDGFCSEQESHHLHQVAAARRDRAAAAAAAHPTAQPVCIAPDPAARLFPDPQLGAALAAAGGLAFPVAPVDDPAWAGQPDPAEPVEPPAPIQVPYF